MRNWNQTLRYPTAPNAVGASRNDLVAQQLDNNAGQLKTRLYNLFVNFKNYTTFSNEAWIPSGSSADYDSIESLHDLIHGLTGSGGHMSYVDYSAFDPLFFLHHAMVDRCFAMWQILNPDSYVIPEKANFAQFTTSRGQIQDSSSALTPFHSDLSGNFWTSDSVRTTETFNYAYPETANTAAVAAVAMLTKVTEAINRLYGTPAPTNATSKTGKRQAASADKELAATRTYREWMANIRVRKHALSGPFFIHLFLGKCKSDPFSWSFDPNLVGTQSVFVRAATSPADSDQEVTATISLSHKLLEKVKLGIIRNLEPEAVEQYLQQNLRYRITRVDDTEVPNGQLDCLKITVVSSVVQAAGSGCEFPVWGAMDHHFEVDGSV